jgi:hypothetical protein
MLRAREFRVWILISVLVLGGLAGALAGGAVRAASPRQIYAGLSVVISEVAWGGTAASTDDQWIELYNPGGLPINLSGWLLKINDTESNISLVGTIPAGGFFLLERAYDQTVSNLPADQVFLSVNGLSPGGGVLRLFAPGTILIDTANLYGVNGGGWTAGSASPGFYSMERVDLLPDGPGAWASNNGIVRNGLDANGDPLNGPLHPPPPQHLPAPILQLTPTLPPQPALLPIRRPAPQLPPRLALPHLLLRPPFQ